MDKTIENNFLKALMFLDRDKIDNAKIILNDIFEITKKNNNKIYYIKVNTILGELNYNKGNIEIAKKYLLNVINTKLETEYYDILDYEIKLCNEILNEINK